MTEPPPPPAWIAEAAESLSQENGGRAVTVGVRLPDGTYWSSKAGVANVASGAAARSDDWVEIGSSTKAYTAAAVLRLHERGVIDIANPVTDYLSADLFDGLLAVPASEVAVWMLLNHTAGIPDYINVGSDEEVIGYYNGQDDAVSPEQALQFARDLGGEPTPPFPEMARYSNTGYILLGLLLEEVTGLSYREVIEQEILEPLGLERTRHLGPGVEADRSGYASGVTTEAVSMPDGMAWSAGDIVADPEDVAEFYFHVGEGTVYENEATHDLQLDGYPAQLGPYSYGLGVMLEPSGQLLEHTGQTFGFINYPSYHRESGVVVVINVNDSQAWVPEATILDLHEKAQGEL